MSSYAEDQERRIVAERGLTWTERLRQMGSYGTSGGTAGDRRAFVKRMATEEAADAR